MCVEENWRGIVCVGVRMGVDVCVWWVWMCVCVCGMCVCMAHNTTYNGLDAYLSSHERKKIATKKMVGVNAWFFNSQRCEGFFCAIFFVGVDVFLIWQLCGWFCWLGCCMCEWVYVCEYACVSEWVGGWCSVWGDVGVCVWWCVWRDVGVRVMLRVGGCGCVYLMWRFVRCVCVSVWPCITYNVMDVVSSNVAWVMSHTCIDQETRTHSEVPRLIYIYIYILYVETDTHVYVYIYIYIYIYTHATSHTHAHMDQSGQDAYVPWLIHMYHDVLYM